MERYRQAHKFLHKKAVREIRAGKKEGHWVWFELPQAYGLEQSEISEYYGLRGLEEARAYLEDKTLKSDLYEICEELLKKDDVIEILGELDAKKCWSSMTLFAMASEKEESVFHRVIKKFYGSRYDDDTLKVLYKYYKGDII